MASKFLFKFPNSSVKIKSTNRDYPGKTFNDYLEIAERCSYERELLEYVDPDHVVPPIEVTEKIILELEKEERKRAILRYSR